MPAIERLSRGTAHHLPIADAVEKAFRDVSEFMKENADILRAKPDRMARRMADLESYKSKVMQNFTALANGVKEYMEAQHTEASFQPT